MKGVIDFALAPLTESFIAIQQKAGDEDSLSVWATTDAKPVPMNKAEHEFDAASIEDIKVNFV